MLPHPSYPRQAIVRLNTYLIVSFCFALAAHNAVAQADEMKVITELETQRNQAIVLGDEKVLRELLDESFSGVTAAGKVIDKAAQIEIFKSTNPHVTFATENVAVHVYETTATVTGTLVSKAKSGTTIGKTRYLYVYLKQNNHWKIILGQETVVIKE